eukprot:7385483-Prymnesium_polylepis.1
MSNGGAAGAQNSQHQHSQSSRRGARTRNCLDRHPNASSLTERHCVVFELEVEQTELDSVAAAGICCGGDSVWGVMRN